MILRVIVDLNTIVVDITISCRSFVFSQSRTKVSASHTEVSGLVVAAFDLIDGPNQN